MFCASGVIRTPNTPLTGRLFFHLNYRSILTGRGKEEARPSEFELLSVYYKLRPLGIFEPPVQVLAHIPAAHKNVGIKIILVRGR